MKLEFKDTGGGRGLNRATFLDRYGVECSIQNSSLATEDAIWLGQQHCGKCDDPTRMHLTREQVAALLPALQHFVDHGALPTGSADHGK